MQNLQLTIQIPEEYVLITKVEYEGLLDNVLLGKFITMHDLVVHTGKSKPWLHENLLNHPKRMKEIAPFTYFPKSRGDKWAFKAKDMYEYLDQEFLNILEKKE